MKTEEYWEYLQKRRQMNKKNYYLESLREIEEIRREYDHKPRLLLHACCAVCAGWPLEFLSDVFDITIYYANSNIWPAAEYNWRLSELQRFVKEVYGDAIEVIVPAYDNAAYTKKLEPLKDDPEGFRRCFLCYAERMGEAYQYAAEHGFDYFTTVMSSSRQKDSQKINETGKALSARWPQVRYFYSDFKKKGGQERRDELAAEHDLYRQDYCSCIYSWEERFLPDLKSR
ncbi:MAG: epoxyqueuosine reductase QueH [Solobacterium sp.]|nr:epoxyqueuosine reductase QueH [Solobacterium sp.]